MIHYWMLTGTQCLALLVELVSFGNGGGDLTGGVLIAATSHRASRGRALLHRHRKGADGHSGESNQGELEHGDDAMSYGWRAQSTGLSDLYPPFRHACQGPCMREKHREPL